MKVETQHEKGCVVCSLFAMFAIMFSCYGVLTRVTKCSVAFFSWTEKTLGHLNNMQEGKMSVFPFGMSTGCLSGHGIARATLASRIEASCYSIIETLYKHAEADKCWSLLSTWHKIHKTGTTASMLRYSQQNALSSAWFTCHLGLGLQF